MAIRFHDEVPIDPVATTPGTDTCALDPVATAPGTDRGAEETYQ